MHTPYDNVYYFDINNLMNTKINEEILMAYVITSTRSNRHFQEIFTCIYKSVIKHRIDNDILGVYTICLNEAIWAVQS